ncbi:MAG TPA: CBS domain-containing protein [Gemmatimonadaceae bacterium]|jgi:CBS domain-containing protein
MLKLSDIMTKDVVTVTPETTLRDAVELFTARHISGAPVVSGNGIVGVISATDVLGFAASTPDAPTGLPGQPEWQYEAPIDEESEGADLTRDAYLADFWVDDSADVADRMTSIPGVEWSVLDQHTVDEVMTRGVVALSPNDPVSDAAELMGRQRIHRVIVVKKGRLAGIVSALDVARALAEQALTRPVEQTLPLPVASPTA